MRSIPEPKVDLDLDLFAEPERVTQKYGKAAPKMRSSCPLECEMSRLSWALPRAVVGREHQRLDVHRVEFALFAVALGNDLRERLGESC